MQLNVDRSRMDVVTREQWQASHDGETWFDVAQVRVRRTVRTAASTTHVLSIPPDDAVYLPHVQGVRECHDEGAADTFRITCRTRTREEMDGTDEQPATQSPPAQQSS